MIKSTGIAAIAIAIVSPAAALMAQPMIRVGTRLVEVEVVVRDKDGPLTGLTPEDFTLLDQGAKQKIAEFSEGAFGKETAGRDAAKPPVAPLPSGAVSNRIDRAGHPIAGATVLLLDLLNTTLDNQAYARGQIQKFVESAPEGEQLAIYMLGKELTVIQDFTDHSGTAEAVKMWDPKIPLLMLGVNTEGMDAIDRGLYDSHPEIRRGITEQAVAKIAAHVSGMEGRKSLVWVSDTPGWAGAQFLGMANIHLYPVLARGVGTSGVVGWLQTKKEATAAGLSAQSIGLGMGDDLDRQSANAALAAANGSAAFMDSSSIAAAVHTAIEDARNIYTLGFYPSEESLDNKFHTLTVNVSKQGAARGKTIELRYRPGYLATLAGPSGKNPAADAVNAAIAANPRPMKPRLTLDQLLSDPIDINQVDVTAEPTADPARPGYFQIKVKIDPRDLTLQHENARQSGSVDISFSVQGSGKVVTKTLKIDIADDEFDALIDDGIQTIESIDAAAGAENLRVVVQDRATGAAGTVTVPLSQR